MISQWGIPKTMGFNTKLLNVIKFGTNGQWIGLRENLQETIDFPPKYEVFL
jgi:hypothetical protein